MKHGKFLVLKGLVFRHFFFLIRKIVTTRDWLVVAGLMLLCIIYLFILKNLVWGSLLVNLLQKFEILRIKNLKLKIFKKKSLVVVFEVNRVFFFFFFGIF